MYVLHSWGKYHRESVGTKDDLSPILRRLQTLCFGNRGFI